MCVAIACAIVLILYERQVVAKTGSVAVDADQTHYFGDLATNIGVVVAIVLAPIWAGRWPIPSSPCWWPAHGVERLGVFRRASTS